MFDPLTPAFEQLTDCADSTTTSVRTRASVAGARVIGKTARLLRRGDVVALQDLDPDRARHPGTATVLDIHRTETDQAFVLTTDQGFHSIPGSRLLLVRRFPTSQEA